MISSIVGALIKKPEENKKLNIPNKTVFDFTVLQKNKRGQKSFSIFYNLTMIVGTENQHILIESFEKGTVLSFAAPKVTYVSSKDTEEGVTINISADVNSFEIIGSRVPSDSPASVSKPASVSRRPGTPVRQEDSELPDPFAENDSPF